MNSIFKNKIVNKNLKIYEDRINFSQISKKTKIFLFNYDSTGFYENLIMNIPSVYFATDALNHLNNKSKDIYNELEENKIIIQDRDLLKNHLEKIWATGNAPWKVW